MPYDKVTKENIAKVVAEAAARAKVYQGYAENNPGSPFLNVVFNGALGVAAMTAAAELNGSDACMAFAAYMNCVGRVLYQANVSSHGLGKPAGKYLQWSYELCNKRKRRGAVTPPGGQPPAVTPPSNVPPPKPPPVVTPSAGPNGATPQAPGAAVDPPSPPAPPSPHKPPGTPPGQPPGQPPAPPPGQPPAQPPGQPPGQPPPAPPPAPPPPNWPPPTVWPPGGGGTPPPPSSPGGGKIGGQNPFDVPYWPGESVIGSNPPWPPQGSDAGLSVPSGAAQGKTWFGTDTPITSPPPSSDSVDLEKLKRSLASGATSGDDALCCWGMIWGEQMTALSAQDEKLCGPPPDVSGCEFNAIEAAVGGLKAASAVGGSISVGVAGLKLSGDLLKATHWIKPENRIEIGKALCTGSN